MGRNVLFLCLVLATVYLSEQATIIGPDGSFVFNSQNFKIEVDNVDQKAVFKIEKFNKILHRFHLSDSFGKNWTKSDTDSGFILHGSDRDVEFKIIEDSEEFSLVKVLAHLEPSQNDQHCVDLETGHMNWFGGPHIYNQYWPVEKNRFDDFSYVFGVVERYWLNSRGGFIYVDDKVPLFIDQNVNGNELCFKARNALPYNVRRKSIDLVYHLGAGKDPKQAQKKAVKHFLNKPTGVPDRRIVEHPIWSTWARYKRDINETSLEQYASEIEKYNFNNSQLEIDDDWEVCYGALKFKDSKFSNIKNQIEDLKRRGFRVTVWVHPFINKGCDPWYSEAKQKGYFITNYNGSIDTQWWNSQKASASHIDFTNPAAAEWFSSRLKTLQKEVGIDSYKFDAGEVNWPPEDPKYNADLEDHPLVLTKTYVRAVSEFGPMIEVRTGLETQDLPIWTRFIDKETEWTYRNGLPTMITSLLQMNMVGYGFNLPDMVGGNGYNHAPDEELFIRWLQSNVFMPSIQYSYVPWEYSEKAIEICRHFTDLHAQYADEIMKTFDAAVKYGEPVNPPIWWLDPHDEVAFSINDEFLLGDRILSAPVVQQGAVTRDVYLPKGKWHDMNLNQTYKGPLWLAEYPAPIGVLPYFIRE